MVDGKVILGIDCSSTSFRRGLKRIKDPQRQQQVRDTLKELLFLDIDRAPAKLHLHQLPGRSVPSVFDPRKKVTPWTLHVTADDRYKASFTFEGSVAYFRVCDEHDVVDKDP